MDIDIKLDVTSGSSDYENTITEQAVLKIYSADRKFVVEKIKKDEDFALFIVNHPNLAGLNEGLPGNNYSLAHIAVKRHPKIALHVIFNRPEIHDIHSALGSLDESGATIYNSLSRIKDLLRKQS